MAENSTTVKAVNHLKLFLRFVEKVPKLEALHAFKELLREMSSDDRERHFHDMYRVYHTILHKPVGLSKKEELQEAYVDSLRIMLAGGGGPEDPSLCDFFLQLFPPSTWEYILSRVSGESWWDIRGSTLLVRYMQDPPESCMVLLKYGYPYRFDRTYLSSHFPSFTLRLAQSSRLQMALHIMRAVFKEHRSMERANLSLMWKTVPHPIISSTEMFRLMSSLLPDDPQWVRDLCELYVERNTTVFEEVPEVTCPRTLLHLSRVQVRRNLLDAKSLNHGTIDGLDIPRTLKGYLKLDSF